MIEVVLNGQTFLFKTSYNWEKTLRYLSVWNIEDKIYQKGKIGNFWITWHSMLFEIMMFEIQKFYCIIIIKETEYNFQSRLLSA